MTEEQTQSAATEDRLDLTALTPADDRELRVEVIWREVTEDGPGQIVERTEQDFPIRSSLSIPTMTSLLRLETSINKALAEDDEEAEVGLEKALARAHAKIVEIITDRSPGAFRAREVGEQPGEKAAVGSLELDVSQILMTLAWLAGDTSVADAVARTLSAGRSPAKTEEELEADRVEAGDDDPEAESRTPLVSSKAS